MITEADIRKITETIVEKVHPESIILFGSMANGTADEESDVDLIVVREATEEDTDYLIRKALWDAGVSVPVDLIVADPGFIRQRYEIGDQTFIQMVESGKRLYG